MEQRKNAKSSLVTLTEVRGESVIELPNKTEVVILYYVGIILFKKTLTFKKTKFLA